MHQRVALIRCCQVIFAALVVAVLGMFGRPLLAQSDDTITIVPAVSPSSGGIDNAIFQVTLTLDGDGGLCQATTVSTPADMLLVIDRSDSMNEGTGAGSGTKLELLKVGANAFLQQVDLSRDRVGIVLFNELANIDVPPTNDLSRLQNAITNIVALAGTSIGAGIDQATRQFELSNQSDPGRRQVMIVLSDGDSDPDEARDAAAEAQAAGVRVITIAFGANANQGLLQELASQPSDFYPVTDPTQLTPIYETIASEIRKPIAARSLTVRHTIDASAIEVDPASITAGGVLNGNEIIWNLNEQLNVATELGYNAKPRAPGAFTIDRGTEIDYLRCESEQRTLALPAALNVQVEPPPSPTATLTPRPTLPPGPTPLPTATPTLPEAVGLGAAAFICTNDWINLLLWLLAIGLTAWFLWRFFQNLQAIDDPSPPGPGQAVRRPNPCRWLLWLFLPLSLVLLTFLLPILAGPGCGARESVYFWRIDSGQSNGSIYVTELDRVGGARPLTAVNNGQCVGCHAVSSSTYQIASIAGGGVGTVEVRSLDGELVTLPDVQGSYVGWSPDGSKLAVSTGDQQIVIVDIAQGSVTPLQGANDPNVAQVMPAWSPDGQTIAFVRGPRSDQAWTVEDPSDIYTVPAAGGQADPIIGASGEGFNYYPAFSPDGRWLAFTRHVSGTTTYAAPEAEIFLVPSGGGERIRLAANDGPGGQTLPEASNSWPTWSRDGRLLAFTSKRNDAAYDIFVTNIDANGNSGQAQPLAGAAEANVFEHLPFWGVPPEVDPWAALLGLWPCLVPFLMVLLAWLVCRSRKADPVVPVVDPERPPQPLEAARLYPLWQVAPSLIIGVGGTGRWVLTHLKKTLRDGGGGALPPQIRFVLLDTAEREQATQFRDARGQITRVEFAGVSLDADEVFLLDQSLRDLIAKAHSDDSLADWVPESYGNLNLDAVSLATGSKDRRPMARMGLIDKLRKLGADNVPAARDKVASDAAMLWKTLLEATTAVKDGDQVRIIVVGSLAGGMSGTLFDLAYLARRAARQTLGGDKVYLDGYLTTAGAFRQQLDGLARRQLNMMATLRELQRFQLYQGASMRFTYDTGAEAPEPLVGSLTWPLFDTVTLFGDKANPQRGDAPGGVKKSDEPWATTFASLSDIVAFRLERAVAQELEQGRSKTQTDIALRQREVQQAVVSSAGSFVYRLPLVDILEIIRARWSFALLDMFLGGGARGAQAAESTEDGAARTAERFVLAEHEAGIAPNGMRTAGLLATDRPVQARRIVTFGDNDGRPFADYLNHALLLILQGGQRRSGGPKLDAARSFIVAVIGLLSQALAEAEKQTTIAPSGSSRSLWQRIWIWLGRGKAFDSEWERVVTRIEAWLAIARQSERSLKELIALIYGDDEQRAGDQGPGQRMIGLYRELENSQAVANARRKQMDQVAVRRYLWSVPLDPDGDPADPQNQQDLVDQWYTQAAERLLPYLPRFYWSMLSDGTLIFGIDKHKIAVQKADTETVEALKKAIDELAIHATQDLAVVVRGSGSQQSKELAYQIKDVLPSQLPTAEARPEERLLEQIWPIAQPHLDPARDSNGDVDGEALGMVGVPDNVQNDPRYARLLTVLNDLGTPRTRVERTSGLVKPRTISTKDRTAFTLVREYARLPILRVEELIESLKVYARNAGRQTEKLVGSATEAAVFQAEANALHYERRLESPQISQDFRLLHPLVVTALERPDITRLYGLALAAGWLRNEGEQVILRLPGAGEQNLGLLAAGEAHPFVRALLRLTTSGPSEPSVVGQLRSALSNPTDEVRAAWQRFIQSYQPRATPAVQPPPVPVPTVQKCSNPKCGRDLKPGAKFCGNCKTPVPVVSPTPQPAPLPTSAGPAFAYASQDMQDLAVVAALAAAQQLDPAGWGDLVMGQPRKLR